MKLFKYVLISICVLVLIQIVTFNFIGRHTIKNELLPPSFAIKSLLSDSVYVPISTGWRCYPSNIENIQLELKESELKEKLKAKHIDFEDIRSNEKAKKKNRKKYFNSTQYSVYILSGNWKNLYNIFEFQVTEELSKKHKHNFRQSNYKWILFTWIKTYEKK